MIRELTLRAGATPSQDPLTVALSPVTIFVGPNNSGKTRVLSEIMQFATSGHTNTGWSVLRQVKLNGLSSEDANAVLRDMEVPALQNELQHQNHRFYKVKNNNRLQIQPPSFLAALTDPNNTAPQFCSWFLSHHTLMLDGPIVFN